MKLHEKCKCGHAAYCHWGNNLCSQCNCKNFEQKNKYLLKQLIITGIAFGTVAALLIWGKSLD